MSCSFGVHGASPLDPGHTAVIGRCFSGTLRVGAIFSEVRGPAEGHVRPVALTIVRIEAYGRHLQTLDTGLTARLVLSGEALDLPDGCVLCTSTQTEP